MLNPDEISIIHWFPDLEKHKCGYCKSKTGSTSYGMWAESLNVEDYQNLIDRGWRRSGQYCYKPMMHLTCCPQYTIRCDVKNFKISKSQKKLVKKVNKYQEDGNVPKSNSQHEDYTETSHVVIKDRPEALDLGAVSKDVIRNDANDETEHSGTSRRGSSFEKSFKAGLGADPNKPPCKKAKLLRFERKQQRMAKSGMAVDKPSTNESKSLSDLLGEVSKASKHKLRMKLVRMDRDHVHFRLTAQLYTNYQMFVHNDSKDDCGEDQFYEFLVKSPLEAVQKGAVKYGSFHQQYWLDDKLIAVGVIDILPKCISSVYFFYDPDYRGLTLGTYGALREIDYTKSLHRLNPSLLYYYMGFYIHSCPKMRYKGKFLPSDLLCPETFEWFPIERCIEKLDASKYSRLNGNPSALDANACSDEDLKAINIYFNGQFCKYRNYKYWQKYADVFKNIATLLGKKCARTVLVVSPHKN